MTKHHLDWLRTLPCAACGDDSAMSSRDAHHLIAGRYGRGMRPPDWLAIPLCAKCHRPNFAGSVHHDGDEARWMATKKLRGQWLAGALWAASGDCEAAISHIERAR